MMSDRIRIGFKTEEGRMRHGLMIDWNVHGTRFVGLFFRGRAFLGGMRFDDGSWCLTFGRSTYDNFTGRWIKRFTIAR